MAITETAELECPECGATENNDGVTFTSQAGVNRHMAAKHPDEWEKLRLPDDRPEPPEAAGSRPRGRPKGSVTKKAPKGTRTPVERRDLTVGIRANVAVLGLAAGSRNPWKGQVLTGMAGKIAEDANESAQAGPDWYYKAWEMAAMGGPHMAIALDVVAIFFAFRAEAVPGMRPMVATMRLSGVPSPTAPWEAPGSVPPAKPPPGPKWVDIDDQTSPGPAAPEKPVANGTGSIPANNPPVDGAAAGPDLDTLRSLLPPGFELNDEQLAQAADMAQTMMMGNGGSVD